MSNYHVQKRPDGDWGVRGEGNQRDSAVTRTQQEARERARDLAQSSGGGEVRIHRADNNEIRDSDTIGKSDPYPPRG